MMEPDALQNFMVGGLEKRGTRGDKIDWKQSGTFSRRQSSRGTVTQGGSTSIL